MNSRRRFHVALVFVWALAHGMWMGAVWHAAGAHGPVASNRASLCCGAKSCASISKTTPSAPACAVCALATVAPDAPPVITTPILPPRLIADVLVRSQDRPRVLVTLSPLSRGPPQFS